MLDGSLIAFMALKLGLSCPAVFADLAYAARARAVNDKQNVEVLAEAACQQENPDDTWVSAYIKTGFQSRVIQQQEGKMIIGNHVDELLALPSGDPVYKQEMSVGVFLLDPEEVARTVTSFRSLPPLETASDRLRLALSPRAQMLFLEATEKRKFYPSCGDGWLKCWVLQSSTQKEQQLWASSEVILAKTAAHFLAGKDTGAASAASQVSPPSKSQTAKVGKKNSGSKKKK